MSEGNPDEIFDEARDQHASGHLAEAVALYRRFLELRPDHAEGWFFLGLATFQLNAPQEAVDFIRRAIEIDSAVPEYHCDLGKVLQRLKDHEGAIAATRRAISLRAEFPEAHLNLASSLHAAGRLTEAIAAYRRTLGFRPDCADAWNDLGAVLHRVREDRDAIAAFGQALHLRPDFPMALFNLANALSGAGLIGQAIDRYHQAIALKPDYADALNNLGMSFFGIGRIDDALDCFNRILADNPADASAHSNRIYAMHFDPSFGPADIRRELRDWNARHATPLKRRIRPHTNSRDPDRPLRIGYISADFREHVVGWNLLPLLRCQDRATFAAYCYSNGFVQDPMTEKLRCCASVWRDIVDLTDEQAASLVREDGIDALVDLSLHTGGNRLRVFALKPAPVQITYLGYPGSTGLDAIDYRISGPGLDADEDVELYSERTYCLPHTYWCYQPGGPTPPVSPLPAISARRITFGCLNHFAKVSNAAVNLWMRVLLAVPDSRLLLHAQAEGNLKPIHEGLTVNGITPDRLEIIPRAGWQQYIESYARIDIALDPFPYCGGITTCDSLYMGVPVVTLSGQTPVGRSGSSILGNVGLTRMVARTPEHYLHIATALASNLSDLGRDRQSLRQRIQSSPIMNAPQFARDVQAAYRWMWQDWCRSSSQHEPTS